MTKIEWAEKTWNPIVGCSIVSPGCTNCYAMRMAARLERMNPQLSQYRGLTQPSKAGPVWTGKVALAPDRVLLAPLKRRKPTMWFVNSMSDLFHEDVPDEWIDRVLAVMGLAAGHTFQILTKRSARMRRYMTDRFMKTSRICELANEISSGKTMWAATIAMRVERHGFLPNVWLGVSAESQQEADARIPDLLATPAAVRFVSAEPLLGPIDFTKIKGVNACPDQSPCRKCREDGGIGHPDRYLHGLDWIIVGGESGPGARPMVLSWAKDIVLQCKAAGVPVFVKQLGAEPTNREGERCPHIIQKKGADVSEWPAELRVREWPHA